MTGVTIIEFQGNPVGLVADGHARINEHLVAPDALPDSEGHGAVRDRGTGREHRRPLHREPRARLRHGSQPAACQAVDPGLGKAGLWLGARGWSCEPASEYRRRGGMADPGGDRAHARPGDVLGGAVRGVDRRHPPTARPRARRVRRACPPRRPVGGVARERRPARPLLGAAAPGAGHTGRRRDRIVAADPRP